MSTFANHLIRRLPAGACAAPFDPAAPAPQIGSGMGIGPAPARD